MIAAAAPAPATPAVIVVWSEGEETMPLSNARRMEYETRWQNVKVMDGRRAEVESSITHIMKARSQYEEVERIIGVPWYLVGAIHTMECDGDFSCHLHNGDSLKARTKHEPKGRPLAGKPPFGWVDSACDALRMHGFDVWTDWSVAGMLFKLEAYNGTGYQSRGIPTPYLWSGSQFYTKGKFTADHGFDPNAVSKQIGAAVILIRMYEQALIDVPHKCGATSK